MESYRNIKPLRLNLRRAHDFRQNAPVIIAIEGNPTKGYDHKQQGQKLAELLYEHLPSGTLNAMMDHLHLKIMEP